MSADPTADRVPDVSVVIVNWNTRDLLQQTLESLYRETQDVTFETIVADNASTDGGVELIRRAWKQVCLIALPDNRGFAYANNAGFARARGRYILLLNSDTIVLRSTLAGMVRFLDAHPGAGCVGCRHLASDGTLQGSMDSFPGLLKDFLCYSELRRVRWLLPFIRQRFPWWSNHDEVREVDWVNGSCLMVRREAIWQVGVLDETFFLYAEEIDWCYRMRQAGWRVYFTPHSEIIHIGGQSTGRISDRRVVLLYEGQYRFYRKHYPAWKYAALRAIVRVAAVFRLATLACVYVLSQLGKRTAHAGGEILTQEPRATEPAAMLRAWWTILRLPW